MSVTASVPTGPALAGMEDIPENERLAIAFRDLTYTVPVKVGKKMTTKTILDGVSGYLRPGKFTVILGSSGAGKTSLLNVLAGEARTGTLSGSVMVNGKEASGSEINRLSGFVHQDDVVLETMTVKEAITMSALLRIPPDISHTDRLQRVSDTIDMMQLNKAENTIIGSPDQKGVSGGERKRTCISMELVTNPSILFLDEPTSGLDSYTAFTVCDFLKNLSHSGRTVVATLHQPSSEIFHLIDDLILMADGKMMYAGPASESVGYFARQGFPCPQYSNPADFFFMSIFNSASTKEEVEGETPETTVADITPTEIEKATVLSAAAEKRNKGDDTLRTLLTAWPSTPEYQTLIRGISDLQNGGIIGYERTSRKYRAPFFTQFPVVMRRAWSNALRNKMIVKVKIGQAIFLGFIIDVIFWKIPNRGVDAQLQDRAGILFFYIMNMVMANAMGILAVFSKERYVFEREYRSGLYDLPAYFLSKTMVELPFLVCIPLFFVAITYFAVGLQAEAGTFFITAVIVIIMANVGTGIGLCAACSFKALEIALAVVPVSILPLMMFSGLFVNLNDVPAWIRWFKWLSPMKYGYVALITNEFDGQTINGMSSDQALDHFGLTGQGSVAVNIAALLGFWIILWGLSYLGLWRLVSSNRGSLAHKKGKTA